MLFPSFGLESGEIGELNSIEQSHKVGDPSSLQNSQEPQPILSDDDVVKARKTWLFRKSLVLFVKFNEHVIHTLAKIHGDRKRKKKVRLKKKKNGCRAARTQNPGKSKYPL